MTSISGVSSIIPTNATSPDIFYDRHAVLTMQRVLMGLESLLGISMPSLSVAT